MNARRRAHRAFLHRMPCVICLNDVETEFCHIRYSDSEFGKVNPGMGAKAVGPTGLDWALPMCGKHHRMQHEGREQLFWQRMGIHPLKLCRQLWQVSGDCEEGERIIRDFPRT